MYFTNGLFRAWLSNLANSKLIVEIGNILFIKAISFRWELYLLIMVGGYLSVFMEFFLFNHLGFLYLVFLFLLALLVSLLFFIIFLMSFLNVTSDKYTTSSFSLITAVPNFENPVSTPNVYFCVLGCFIS